MSLLVTVGILAYLAVGVLVGRRCAGKSYYSIAPWTGAKGGIGSACLAFMLGLCFWPAMVLPKLPGRVFGSERVRALLLWTPPEEMERRRKEAEREHLERVRELGLEDGS